MATDRELIEQVQRDVKPRDITLHGLRLDLGAMVALDCGSLKILAAKSLPKTVSWEEWLDIREAWCRCFNAAYLDCTRGDLKGIQRSAESARLAGRTYLLIDYV